MQRIKIMLADGNTLLREGVKRVLAAEKDLRIVAETGDDSQIDKIVVRAKPDVLLLDLEFAKLSTLQQFITAQKQVATKHLVLCDFPDQENILAAAKAGARGFILKRTPPALLIQAIRKIHSGEIWADQQVNFARTFVEIARRTRAEEAVTAETGITRLLSRRELEILTLVTKGLTNAEIARQLFVSPETIKQHLHHIFKKLNVKNRTQAALLMRQKDYDNP